MAKDVFRSRGVLKTKDAQFTIYRLNALEDIAKPGINREAETKEERCRRYG